MDDGNPRRIFISRSPRQIRHANSYALPYSGECSFPFREGIIICRIQKILYVVLELREMCAIGCHIQKNPC